MVGIFSLWVANTPTQHVLESHHSAPFFFWHHFSLPSFVFKSSKRAQIIIMGESPDELPGARTNRIQKKKRGSKNSERRLVEYFAVVSSIPKKNVDGDQSVEMTASLATTRRDDGATAAEDQSSAAAAAEGEKLAEPPVQKKSTNPFDDDSAESRTNNDDDGSDDEEDDDFHFVDDNDFQPVITARYPPEDHKGNPLQESVTCFCHPGGTINLRLESCMPKVSLLTMVLV